MNKIKKANEFTCWKSLAYCCSLKKKCSDRDKALEILGLSKQGYIMLKKNFERDLVRLLIKNDKI